MFDSIKGKLPTLLSDDRILNLIKYSNHCNPLNGYIFELGTFQGGSLEILAKYNPGSDIISIDTFDGIPESTDGVDFHQISDFNMVNFPALLGYFKLIYPAVRLIKGTIPEAFSFFSEETPIKFTHIDLDQYKSIKLSLDFIVPRTVKGGMVLLDDLDQKSTPGCRKAIEEFFEENVDLETEWRGELRFYDSPTARKHYQYLIVK